MGNNFIRNDLPIYKTGEKMKNLTAILAILMLIFVGLACSGDETEKANSLVDEANKFVAEGNKAVQEAESKGKEFDKKVSDASGQREEQQDINKFANDNLIPTYNKIKENYTKAGEKFGEASKLKINDKYKEYLQLKEQEFKKRAEYAESLNAIPNTLAKSQSKDEYLEKVEKDVENSKKLAKEADDIAAKATKIQTDNPTIFKKN
jgi:hypothetical protein